MYFKSQKLYLYRISYTINKPIKLYKYVYIYVIELPIKKIIKLINLFEKKYSPLIKSSKLKLSGKCCFLMFKIYRLLIYLLFE